jgi:hypothetical protein
VLEYMLLGVERVLGYGVEVVYMLLVLGVRRG